MVRTPGHHGHPPQKVPPREGAPADVRQAEERLRDRLAQALAAEERLKQRTQEINGIHKDLKADMQRYKDAKADLNTTTTAIENAKQELHKQAADLRGAVKNTLKFFVDEQTERLQEHINKAIEREVKKVHDIFGDMQSTLMEHQAQLLGQKDSRGIIDEITAGVYKTLQKEMTDEHIALVRVPSKTAMSAEEIINSTDRLTR